MFDAVQNYLSAAHGGCARPVAGRQVSPEGAGAALSGDSNHPRRRVAPAWATGVRRGNTCVRPRSQRIERPLFFNAAPARGLWPVPQILDSLGYELSRCDAITSQMDSEIERALRDDLEPGRPDQVDKVLFKWRLTSSWAKPRWPSLGARARDVAGIGATDAKCALDKVTASCFAS